MTNDTISDVITRLRNASILGVHTTLLPQTKTSQQVLRILKQEGFILDYQLVTISESKNLSRFQFQSLASSNNLFQNTQHFNVTFQPPSFSKPILTNLKRISRPGRRIYARRGEVPRVFGGLGIIILSTSRGLLTDKQAQQQGVGGEVVCSVW